MDGGIDPQKHPDGALAYSVNAGSRMEACDMSSSAGTPTMTATI